MCIAILVSPGSSVSDVQLKNSFDNNPDGAGFSYVSEDLTGHRKLRVFKTMDYEVFLRKFKRAIYHNPESPFLVHFRIATHGTVDKFNCHPFFINKEVSFIHNGIIGGVGVDPVKSDTQVFNDKVLKNLPKDFYKKEVYKILIEKFIVGSKLLTLDIDGHVTIFNESAGHWKDGVWFSNNSYLYAAPKATVYQWHPPAVYFKRGKTKTQEYFYCDGCGVKHNSEDCSCYMMAGEAKVYCADCKGTALHNNWIKASDGISKHRYEIELASEDYYEAQRYCG